MRKINVHGDGVIIGRDNQITVLKKTDKGWIVEFKKQLLTEEPDTGSAFHEEQEGTVITQVQMSEESMEDIKLGLIAWEGSKAKIKDQEEALAWWNGFSDVEKEAGMANYLYEKGDANSEKVHIGLTMDEIVEIWKMTQKEG